MCGFLCLKEAHFIIILVGVTLNKDPSMGFIGIILLVCREASAQRAFKPQTSLQQIKAPDRPRDFG